MRRVSSWMIRVPSQQEVRLLGVPPKINGNMLQYLLAVHRRVNRALEITQRARRQVDQLEVQHKEPKGKWLAKAAKIRKIIIKLLLLNPKIWYKAKI